MASFSVDITSVKFAATNTGYKDITITGRPQAVIGSITGTDASSFGWRIPGNDDSVMRVYTTSHTNIGTSAPQKVATFKITNAADSTDYVEVSLEQCVYYGSTGGVVRDVSLPTNDSAYGLYAGDAFGAADLFFDYTIPTGTYLTLYVDAYPGTTTVSDSWITYTADTVYTDTGFKRVLVTCVNNYDAAGRRGSVSFGGNSTEVYQNPYPGTHSGLDPQTITVPNTGGTYTVVVKYDNQNPNNVSLNKEVGNNQSFYDRISYSVDAGGTYQKSYVVTFGQNTSGNVEYATLRFERYSTGTEFGFIFVKQLGDAPIQTLTVNPQILDYPASGGGRTLDVTYATSLSTNESLFPSWLGATYVSVSQGSGQYTITAASNTSTSSRSFNFELADANMSLAVPITQAGGDPASLSISPTSNSVSSSSGSVQITVTSSGISDVQYSISDSSWITYSGKSGNVYTFNYAAKSSTGSRTGTITFYGGGLSETYTLIQAGASQIVVSPTSESVGSTSGSKTVNVSGPSSSSISYSISQDAQSWLSVTGSGGSYSVSYTANTGSSSRTGVVTFSASGYVSSTYTLTQAGGTLAPFSVSPTELYFNWGRGVANAVDVLFNGNVSASSSSNVSSTRVTMTGGYRYSVSMELSTSSLSPFSTGYITFMPQDGSSRSTTVQCYGNYMNADPIQIDDVPAAGNTYQVTVFYPNASTAGVSLKDKSSFISSVTRSSLSTNYAIFDVVVSSNSTSSARSGYVKFYATGPVSGGSNSTQNNITVTINQLGGSAPTPEIVVSPTSDSVSSSSGSVSITASGASNISYSISSAAQSWLRYVSNSGNVYNFSYDENTSTSSRNGYITFSATGATSATYSIVQAAGSAAITISPTAQTVGSSTGTVSVTVSGGSDVYYTIRPQDSWVTYVGKSGNVYTFRYADNSSTSSRTGLIGFSGSGSSGSAIFTLNQNGVSPGPTPVDTRALKAYPIKLRYYSEGGSIKVSFENRPTAGISSTITYSSGSGWLSVSDSGSTKSVTATANSGSARRASIRFYETGNSSNYVIVPVIQGGTSGYDSIWRDILYFPQNRDADNNYYYSLTRREQGGMELFVGVSTVPGGYSGQFGGIDIPRLVEDHLITDYWNQGSNDWAEMYWGKATIDVNNLNNGYPGVVDATYYFWNDWSRFEKRYDYTRCFNDPINGRGCDNMILPFCVYYDSNDAATFSIVEEEKNGNINTYTFSAPEAPFNMRMDSFYDTKKLEYKQGNDVVFSYDMDHCGPGYFLYRNRFGGWDSFLIEGNLIKTDNYTKQNIRRKGSYDTTHNINSWNYIVEKSTARVDIDRTYQAYTGWLTDEQAERLVFHLLSSPKVYFEDFNKTKNLYDTDHTNLMEVRITNSSAEYKKFRNGKRLVNYLITFEKCDIEKVND